jgi:hypothetical protein
LEPPRLIFEQPPPSSRGHLALAAKIVAGTLAVSVLAAGGVEVFGGFSDHASQDDQLGLSRAFAAVSAPAGAKLASVPNWLALDTTAGLKHHVVVKRAHAAQRHAKRHAKPKAKHSGTHAAAAAHTTAPAQPAHHAVLVASTTPHSTGGTSDGGSSAGGATHSTSSTSHSSPSWSSHYSWHSSTSADGTTTKVTTTSHTTTVDGHPSTTTHTHTTVTPGPSHAAATQ